jgi:NodT family efflux transporter outer membrane factor (OMF) lipoprotein
MQKQQVGRVWGVGGAAVLALVALAGGCTVGRDYVPPQASNGLGLGASFAQLDGTSPLASSADLPDEAMLAAWWEGFGDSKLSELVSRALAGNLDQQLASERVREARALRGIAEGAKFPTLDAGGTAQRQRGSENIGAPGNDRDSSLFDAGLDASWEIDVFGGIRRSVEASRADLQATIEQERAVRVTLAAEVARNYVELRSLQERQRVLDRSIGAQRDTVKLTQERLDAGIAPKLDVAQSQAQLATRLSQLPPVLAGQRAAIHRLGVLLGEQPGVLAAELLGEVSPIPQLRQAGISSGLPSDLLRRRPDVREAERRIAAATARVGVAESDLFPKFSLTGSFGLQSDQVGELADMDSRRWAIGPSVRWNLFDGERLRRAVDAAESREKQALLTYQQTVLLAIEEAENALVDLQFSQARNAALREAVAANQEAVDLADALYRGQLSTFLNVLEGRRQLFYAEDALVLSDAEVARAVIALYKALGGGWSEVQAAEPAAQQ